MTGARTAATILRNAATTAGIGVDPSLVAGPEPGCGNRAGRFQVDTRTEVGAVQSTRNSEQFTGTIGTRCDRVRQVGIAASMGFGAEPARRAAR
jgi:hypothetical protein